MLHSKDFDTLSSCGGLAALKMEVNEHRVKIPPKIQGGDEGTPLKEGKLGALIDTNDRD